MTDRRALRKVARFSSLTKNSKFVVVPAKGNTLQLPWKERISFVSIKRAFRFIYLRNILVSVRNGETCFFGGEPKRATFRNPHRGMHLR